MKTRFAVVALAGAAMALGAARPAEAASGVELEAHLRSGVTSTSWSAPMPGGFGGIAVGLPLWPRAHLELGLAAGTSRGLNSDGSLQLTVAVGIPVELVLAFADRAPGKLVPTLRVGVEAFLYRYWGAFRNEYYQLGADVLGGAQYWLADRVALGAEVGVAGAGGSWKIGPPFIWSVALEWRVGLVIAI
jgi:hypothetical protein